jgi:hypothetical protein
MEFIRRLFLIEWNLWNLSGFCKILINSLLIVIQNNPLLYIAPRSQNFDVRRILCKDECQLSLGKVSSSTVDSRGLRTELYACDYFESGSFSPHCDDAG